MVDFEEVGDCGSELLWKEGCQFLRMVGARIEMTRVDIRGEAMLGECFEQLTGVDVE